MPYISASVQHWNDANRMLQNDEIFTGNTMLIPEERLSDNNSIRSLPIVSVADVLPPSIRPSTGHSPALTPRISPLMSSRPIRSETLRSAGRIGAPRAGTEPRNLNRLSGFLSNLLHRRNATNSAPLHNGGPAVESSAGLDYLSNADLAKSFTVPTRANSPPPSLPPPTLQELGLSLSVLTPDLSPPHFSAPPTSGAFLAPHYLLLCHSQGLDVFPLKSPPALQPYALIRRVNFKDVVVMEHRGVLVAIAGRRDGVRVYALDEIKRAVEWRIDMEIRRERDRIKRESSKRVVWGGIGFEQRGSAAKGKTATITQVANVDRSAATVPNPKSPAIHRNIFTGVQFVDSPPAYISPPDRTSTHRPHDLPFDPSPMDHHRGVEHMDSKVSQWLEGSSDDEAIDMLTAGASGSRALDERTSASTSPHIGDSMSTSHFLPGNQSVQSVHGVRHTDLGLIRPDNASVVPPEPLPSPTLSTLRQALQDTSLTFRSSPTYTVNDRLGEPDAPQPDVDEDDEDGASSTGERITLAQALMESRLPHLPPPGTQQLPQSALAQVPRSGPAAVGGVSSDLRLSDAPSPHVRVGQVEVRRRRWSVLEGLFSNASGMLLSPPFSSEGSNTAFPPEVSFSSRGSLYPSLHARPEATQNHTAISNDVTSVVSSQLTSQIPFRFLPRNLNNMQYNRRTDVPPPMPLVADVGNEKGNIHLSTAPHVPPPRLEYVKLPGTKGSLIVKAVETPKKSFLAILCGEHGEKVELFAGTYRSALGLSRTFILPDSPRSLELQLQGDDLVEVFLVFSQNVFGLEPATVRVREVRIGRSERRAARRRVREIRSGQTDIFEGDLLAPDDEDANISINIGVSLAGNESRITRTTSNSQLQDIPQTSTELNHDTALAHAEELVAMTTTHMGPYTTFQQLSFAPKFPLATIANDYIIPPTYPQFLEYRSEYEPGNGDADLSQTQFSPPGLPKPVPTPPSKWLYRDPKGATHGPWKASLMQAWYNDGLLPPDLPVRKEQDTQFMLLKDLRQQSIDPSHPFRLVPSHSGSEPQSSSLDVSKPLLSPVSLLAQPRHFGPPALFYSSRGGHSTTIVDARGRSVLQGRFLWSEDSGQKASESSMGDIKHLEAFDVEDRSVIVAMRQGGLEAMDFGDALLKPADQSRTVLPHFTPSPSNINRREPFVWKIGTPIASSSPPAVVVPSKVTSSYSGRKRTVKTARGTGSGINGVHEAVGQNEVLFLGRKGDVMYLCERTASTFKILRLCPGHSVAS